VPPSGRVPKTASVEAAVERIVSLSCTACGLCLAALMSLQVVLRYVFASPLVGIEELSLLFGAWFYFLGIACVTRKGEHIRGGVLTMLVGSPNAVRSVRLAVTVLSAVAGLVFAWYAVRYALFELETGRRSSYMRWPKAWWSASLLVGFSVTAASLVHCAIRQWVDFAPRHRNSGEAPRC